MTRFLAISRRKSRVTYRACEELMAVDGRLEVIGQSKTTEKKRPGAQKNWNQKRQAETENGFNKYCPLFCFYNLLLGDRHNTQGD